MASKREKDQTKSSGNTEKDTTAAGEMELEESSLDDVVGGALNAYTLANKQGPLSFKADLDPKVALGDGSVMPKLRTNKF